jgi:DNA replication protein DnaC
MLVGYTDYRMATPEQRAALHYSEEGHNILITGQCGTGKTF